LSTKWLQENLISRYQRRLNLSYHPAGVIGPRREIYSVGREQLAALPYFPLQIWNGCDYITHSTFFR
jgi:hypothetical protein